MGYAIARAPCPDRSSSAAGRPAVSLASPRADTGNRTVVPPGWGSQPGNASPVNRDETRVTCRRIFQFLIDAFLVSLIPSLVSIPFDRSNSTTLNIIGGLVYFVLFVLIGLWYWVIRPHGHVGQTFGMQLLGLRVISKNGGPASMAQLFVRWICLLFDAAPVDLAVHWAGRIIVILCSRTASGLATTSPGRW